MKITPIAIGAAVALLQWLVFALMSAFSRTPAPKRFLASTAVFATTWLVILGLALPSKDAKASTTNASAAATSSGNGGNCIGVERGMSAADVDAKAGKPDEVRSDEDIRGPGAAIRIYRDGRCAVHMLGEKVEFVD